MPTVVEADDLGTYVLTTGNAIRCNAQQAREEKTP
jgi:hypothetical protein